MDQQVDLPHVRMEYKKLLGMIMTLLIETNTFFGHPANRGEEKLTYNEKAKKQKSKKTSLLGILNHSPLFQLKQKE